MSVSPQLAVNFGVYRPLEFFDCFIVLPKFDLYITLLIEKWEKPDRATFYAFIKKLVKFEASSQKTLSSEKDFGKLFTMIGANIPYFGFCSSYIVVGNEDGEAIAFERQNGNEIWRKKISIYPISFISVAPNGQRFLFVVQNDQMVTWVAKGKKNAEELFEMVDSNEWNFELPPVRGEWLSQKKVALFSHQKKLCEMLFPDGGFFKNLFRK